MTAGEKLFDALGAARIASGGKLTKERWIQIADDFLVTEGAFRKKTPGRAKLERPRNLLFDTLALATGTRNESAITRDAAKVVAIALADIKEVAPNVTPEEIIRVVEGYKRKYPTWPVTPKAIAKYWGEFSGGVTRSARRDTTIEPKGWREAAVRLFPDARGWVNPVDFSTVSWVDVPFVIKADILKAANA